tara:strand:+ start:5907 stop:8606 length:2700 start_codon:yes stop_codon:yes gene_type:complete
MENKMPIYTSEVNKAADATIHNSGTGSTINGNFDFKNSAGNPADGSIGMVARSNTAFVLGTTGENVPTGTNAYAISLNNGYLVLNNESYIAQNKIVTITFWACAPGTGYNAGVGFSANAEDESGAGMDLKVQKASSLAGSYSAINVHWQKSTTTLDPEAFSNLAGANGTIDHSEFSLYSGGGGGSAPSNNKVLHAYKISFKLADNQYVRILGGSGSNTADDTFLYDLKVKIEGNNDETGLASRENLTFQIDKDSSHIDGTSKIRFTAGSAGTEVVNIDEAGILKLAGAATGSLTGGIQISRHGSVEQASGGHTASPHLHIHSCDDVGGYSNIWFTDNSDTSNTAGSFSHEWNILALPRAQGSTSNAFLRFKYGDGDGSGTEREVLYLRGNGETYTYGPLDIGNGVLNIGGAYSAQAVNGDAKILLKGGRGSSAGDEWEIKAADGGVLTLGNDIASAGTFVPHLTLTPHATPANSTVAAAGNVTVGGDLTITGLTIKDGGGHDRIQMNNAMLLKDADGTTVVTLGTSDLSTTLAGALVAADTNFIVSSAGDVTCEQLTIKNENIFFNVTSGASTTNIKVQDSATSAHGLPLTISAGSTTGGGSSNMTGGELKLQGGRGKGTGAGGNIHFETANASGTPGAAMNSYATALVLSDDLSASFGGKLYGLGSGPLTVGDDLDLDGVVYSDNINLRANGVSAHGNIYLDLDWAETNNSTGGNNIYFRRDAGGSQFGYFRSDGYLYVGGEQGVVSARQFVMQEGTCSVSLSGNQSLTETAADIEFAWEHWDTGGDFNTTNHTFTAPSTGKYLVTLKLKCDPDGDVTGITFVMYRNNDGAIQQWYFTKPDIEDSASNPGIGDYSFVHILALDANDTLKIRGASYGGTTVLGGTDHYKTLVTITRLTT